MKGYREKDVMLCVKTLLCVECGANDLEFIGKGKSKLILFMILFLG